MKANEIKVGGLYTAKVNGKLTIVRVDAIHDEVPWVRGTICKRYDVTNTATGRKTTFRSAAKFRCVAETPEERKMRVEQVLAEQDAKLLASEEAKWYGDVTPDTAQHAAPSIQFMSLRTNPNKCGCTRCRIIRAMQRQAERLAAENPYREGW